jgi:hypothetical protein
MISAVAFAVYMRIERQASSNYRHTVVARHLLNSALYRAIDEVDSELRLYTNSVQSGVKFPDWPGHVLPSAVPNGEGNDQEARVLSLEALSFLPASLVNDVRRYATSNPDDIVNGVNVSNGKYSYLGAKWRPLSMPILSMVSGDRAFDEAVVGRYAYLCINLSDMLNVNVCKATRRVAGTNQVSIGYLFSDFTVAKTFEDNRKNTDLYYPTLQDFYACMAKRSDPTFSSPYHNWLLAGHSGSSPVSAPDDGYGVGSGSAALTTTLDAVKKHILVTDGIAKPEPVASAQTPMNVQDATLTSLPLEATVEQLVTRLVTIPTLSAGPAGQNHLRNLLMDYLDKDNTPSFKNSWGTGSLYRPTGEMVPMIYRVYYRPNGNSANNPIGIATPVGNTTGSGTSATTTYSLQVAPAGQELGSFFVQSIFPFKHWSSHKKGSNASLVLDPSAYTLDVSAYLVCVPTGSATGLETKNARLLQLIGSPYAFPLTVTIPGGAGMSPMPTTEGTLLADSIFQLKVPSACSMNLYSRDSSAARTATRITCMPGEFLHPAIVFFIGLRQNGSLVDLVPGFLDPRVNPSGSPLSTLIGQSASGNSGIPDRLFFEYPALQIGLTTDTYTIPSPYKSMWSSLEVPDPRFNHKASNWVVGSGTTSISTISDATKAVLGVDGRDSDIYMFSSNQERLYSPGEFGFLVRPFSTAEDAANSVVLANYTLANVSALEDYEHMFRTIRLYDHGGTGTSQKRDDLYNYFSTMNTDGTVTGARVNPLSNVPAVLFAALDLTPVDYWYAVQSDSFYNSLSASDAFKTMFNGIFNTSSMLLSPKLNDISNWGNFRRAWFNSLTNAVTTAKVASSWKYGLPDVYGDSTYFQWYSPYPADPGRTSIFGGTFGTKLDEIDRKMLFSFSHDSFSDRQQLFLYVLRAEATSSALGKNVKSLAGGNAVALVWRDPYPVGYSKANDTWTGKGSRTWYQKSNGALSKTLRRVTPWYQVQLKQYDDSVTADQEDPRPQSESNRTDGYHDFKILYFKQLDN